MTLLSLYFNIYNHILNLLTFENIKEILNKENPLEYLYYSSMDLNNAINKLCKKIMGGESIINELAEIRKLQYFIIMQFSIGAKFLGLNNSLCDYYQIINFLRDPDFCLMSEQQVQVRHMHMQHLSLS